MSEAYRARDTQLGRNAAIEVLPFAFANAPECLARFQRGAQVRWQRLIIPTATIHGLEQSDGAQLLAMELVPGETLNDRLKVGPVPVEGALRSLWRRETTHDVVGVTDPGTGSHPFSGSFASPEWDLSYVK